MLLGHGEWREISTSAPARRACSQDAPPHSLSVWLAGSLEDEHILPPSHLGTILVNWPSLSRREGGCLVLLHTPREKCANEMSSSSGEPAGRPPQCVSVAPTSSTSAGQHSRLASLWPSGRATNAPGQSLVRLSSRDTSRHSKRKMPQQNRLQREGREQAKKVLAAICMRLCLPVKITLK